MAQLSVPSDRIAAMLAAIRDEVEPVVTLTHLLHLCRDEHRVLWERSGDTRTVRKVTVLVNKVAEELPLPGTTAVLEPPVRRALVVAFDQADDIPPVLIARALAELIDECYGHTFAHWFQRRSPYQPGVGDPVPLDSPDLREVTTMRSTSPPWRLAHRLDETRHVRLAGEWVVQFRVVFDYSLFDTLAGVVTADTVVATCHPNGSLGELDLTQGTQEGRFPVRPRDLGRQRTEIDRLVARATAAGASIVVLPELSVTEGLAMGLREWVQRPDGPRVLVAGSYHRQTGTDQAPGRRRNTAIAWVRGHEQPLTHDKYSPADRPVVEDIQPDGWPELRIYPTVDGWHLTIAICRDLLNPQAGNALSEAGANLILVPAMSETLMPFGGPVAHLVGANQAFIAVANNPGEWADGTDRIAARPARALFGHPGLGQQSRLVQPRDSGPGVALLNVRSAAITWLSEPPLTPVPFAVGADDIPQPPSRPTWLSQLLARAGTSGTSARRAGRPVWLRPAAVLVLLSDGPDGPRVLLTERAADLKDYPSELVFPGGALDQCDSGDPVAAALREAQEEVGLDPHCVQVIGLLAPMALPRSGFLVDPVLAWSADPLLSGSVNLAEVAALRHIPLRELAEWATRPSAGAPPHPPGVTAETIFSDPAPLGRMTATVIDQLLGMLPQRQTVLRTVVKERS
ncbi:hypothetical protein N801_01690 [Knoellia aerolata DSM 18566]|uniref:Nudix hydrolase domain-containing protein n=2 Tax=Knoellia TaxID=136099 RepID=A0A0A0JGY8_9MICO|nr:hypothetical protein N801_01690 [Knoellia aerolata DSM 18566]